MPNLHDALEFVYGEREQEEGERKEQLANQQPLLDVAWPEDYGDPIARISTREIYGKAA